MIPARDGALVACHAVEENRIEEAPPTSSPDFTNVTPLPRPAAGEGR